MSPLTIVFPVRLFPDVELHDALVVRTAAALAHAGAKVMLLAPAPLPGLEALLARHGAPPTANLELVPISDAPRFLYRGRLVRRARSIRADVIFTTEPEIGLAFAAERSRLGAPLFHEASALLAERARAARRGAPFFDAAEARLFRLVDGLVLTVETLAERVRRTYAETAPLHVVPLGAAWTAELADAPRPRPGPPRHLGYVGPLHLLHGVDMLIEVLAQLPEHALTIIGGQPAEQEWLKSEAVRFGVLERVRLVPPVGPSALRQALAEVDVLLMPARPRERMPYVAHARAVEYLALDRPIVAADLPSLREDLGDGAAFLVAPEDRHAWANAIRRIDEDPELAARAIQAARRRALERTWEQRAARLLATFSQHLTRP